MLNLRFSDQLVLPFFRDDFHVSFSGFLLNLPVPLQMSRPALEGNRCFFIHLGIALGLHPFLLQTIFRYSAGNILRKLKEQWFEDLLASVLSYCDLVDANSLSFLWPRELDGYYICFLSGNLNCPILTTFRSSRATSNAGLKEVLVHCDGSHFTLLRPRFPTASNGRGFQVIGQLVSWARASGMTVQENVSQEIEGISEEERSIDGVLRKVLSM